MEQDAVMLPVYSDGHLVLNYDVLMVREFWRAFDSTLGGESRRLISPPQYIRYLERGLVRAGK